MIINQLFLTEFTVTLCQVICFSPCVTSAFSGMFPSSVVILVSFCICIMCIQCSWFCPLCLLFYSEFSFGFVPLSVCFVLFGCFAACLRFLELSFRGPIK